MYNKKKYIFVKSYFGVTSVPPESFFICAGTPNATSIPLAKKKKKLKYKIILPRNR